MDQTNEGATWDMKVRILQYLPDMSGYNNPSGVMAKAELLDEVPELGLLSGCEVHVAMDRHATNGNLLIEDLQTGYAPLDVPACPVGSIIEFRGCDKELESSNGYGGDGPVVQASSYAVLETELEYNASPRM